MKRIIMASITAVVVVAVLAGTLIPILDDATTTQDTLKNSGLYYMSAPGTGETYHYEYSGSVWTLNDETLNVSNNYNVIMTDELIIRSYGQFRGSIYASASSIDITVTEGTITGTYIRGETEYSVNETYTTFYGATNAESDFIMSSPTADVNYVFADSEIYGFGITAVGTGQPTFIIEGDMESVTVTPSTGYTVSDVTINKTAVDGYVGVYDFDSVTFTATETGTGTTAAVTYNVVVIPSEITAEKSVHFTDGENAILNAIPVMVIVALLLAIVAMVIRSRMD